MAVLVVAIHAGSFYEAGDIVDAFNDDRIRRHGFSPPNWPNSETELRHFLAVQVDNFTDAEQELMTSSSNGHKRAFRVRLQPLLATLGLVASQAEDRQLRKDVRQILLSRAAIVEAKSG